MSLQSCSGLIPDCAEMTNDKNRLNRGETTLQWFWPTLQTECNARAYCTHCTVHKSGLKSTLHRILLRYILWNKLSRAYTRNLAPFELICPQAKARTIPEVRGSRARHSTCQIWTEAKCTSMHSGDSLIFGSFLNLRKRSEEYLPMHFP